MNASISLNEIVATSDKVKLAQGIALIMVAVTAAVGVGMFAAPTCVWQPVLTSPFQGSANSKHSSARLMPPP